MLRWIEDEKVLRFRCRVGHAFSAHSLLAAQSEVLEEALWSALRLIEEKAEMARRLMRYAQERNFRTAPKKFEEQAAKLEADAGVIRELLQSTQGGET